MKKLHLLFIGALMAGTTMAQEGPKMFAGGSLGFENTSVKDDNSISNFSFTPTWAYMFKPNMGAGININFNTSTEKWENSDEKINDNVWNFEPFFRYYLPVTDNFKFFGDAAISFGGGKTTTTNDQGEERESKSSNFGINILPGAQYWFTPKWSMAANVGRLGYNSTTKNKGDNNESVTNNFGFKVDFTSVKFGLYYHF